MIQTKNLYNTSSYVFLFHCTTHGMKAMRNELFNSWSDINGSKTFLNIDHWRISKSIIEES